MFNIGFTELIILAIIGLLVIGPEQLPDLARKIAKILNELKRAKDEIMAPLDELKVETQFAIQKFRDEIDTQNSKISTQISEKINKPSTEPEKKDS